MKYATLEAKLNTIISGKENTRRVLRLLEEDAGIDVKAICNSKKVVMSRNLSEDQVDAMDRTVKSYTNTRRERRRMVYEAAVAFRDAPKAKRMDFRELRMKWKEKAAAQEGKA